MLDIPITTCITWFHQLGGVASSVVEIKVLCLAILSLCISSSSLSLLLTHELKLLLSSC